MFWALGVVFFRADGGVAEGDSAEALAIVGNSIQIAMQNQMLNVMDPQRMLV